VNVEFHENTTNESHGGNDDSWSYWNDVRL
jgi:hypothetical protein